ncbi:MAG: hypothetical protein U0520_05545 [Candidatus Saccharimonadales bacterium]
MKVNNTIEINGRLYNASTGEPIHDSATKSALKKLPSSRSVDGFQKVKRSADATTKTSRQSTAITVTNDTDLKHKPSATSFPHQSLPPARATANHIKRKAKHSTTLHRQAVNKPSIPAADTVAPQSPKPQQPARISQRLARAHDIEKSSAISHFTRSAATPTPAASTEPTQEQKVSVAPRQSDKTQLPPKHTTVPHATSKNTKERLINQAITAAVAQHHTEATKHPAPKKHRRHAHLTRYASTAALILLVGGYVAYLNVPSISMKVAAHRAGFAAALPGYRPAGYSLSGPIAYSPGQVTINFGSNTDSRRFSLKQQPTTWDSTALLENYVTKQTPNYLTYQDRGLTIYIFNGSSAAWVNGGKMYQLEGKNSQLDTDQLLKLATSV